jgi:hypothetical protein
VKRRHIVLGAISALALTVGGIAPAASAASTHSGIEHFLILQTSEQGSPPVIGTGPIHAAGTDLQLNNHHDRFVFPKGALRIWHTANASHESFDPRTCLATFTERGDYTVLSGTGAYSHATGHGTYHLTGYFFGCNPNDPNNLFSLTLHADGPLSY